VLYAIIRKDGSVDSIQVVRGLHPQMTTTHRALARWKFTREPRGHARRISKRHLRPFSYEKSERLEG